MEREREREGRGHALNSGAAPRLPSQDKAAAAAVDREAAAVSSAVERVTQADVAKELAHYNTHSPVVAKAVAAHRRKQHAQNPTDTDVLSTTLLEACISQGDVDTVQLLVDNGVDVNARLGASYDTSPLRMACKYGQLEVVKLLVAHRVRVNGDDDRGGRPGYSKPVLAIASSHGHLEIVRWLVENGGARVNDETIAGVSPLADAVRRGNLQIARYLVAKGANTMFKSRPWSLWYLAIKLGRLAMLKCFAESKRDDLIQNDHLRLGVLECAAEKGDIGILQSLLALNVFRRLELNECLAKAQSVEFVKLLASKGADVNAYSARGDSPLHTAICNRLVEVIETLLSLGADVNQPGSQGSEHSAIHTMAVCDQLDLLKLVRQICGDAADFRAPGQRYGSTPLHLAAFAGHVDIPRNPADTAREGHLGVVQLLVSEGAAVNHRVQGSGETALFCAAKADWCHIVQFLCEHGADVDCCDYDGLTALCAAARRGHADIVELLAEARIATDTNAVASHLSALHEAVKYGHVDVVRVLLALNVNAHDSQEQWSALVCRTIFRYNVEVVRLLVKHGSFDLNAAYTVTVDDMDFDVTPLVAAAGCGHLRLVKYLCQEGAGIEQAANDNETALFAAAARGNLGVVQYLVGEQNADFEKGNSFGLTPFEVAVDGYHRGVTTYLQSRGALPSQRSVLDQETDDQPSTIDQVALDFLNSEQEELWRRRKAALDLLFSR